MAKSMPERFWDKVERADGCWTWRGSQVPGGYGQFRTPEGRKMAHRVSYELTTGPIPDGSQVDHTCHNRSCVNPAHLRIATVGQNQQNRSGARVGSLSGARGVYPNGSRWRAQVGHEGRVYSAGTYDTIKEAAQAAKDLRMRLHTHNHLDRVA